MFVGKISCMCLFVILKCQTYYSLWLKFKKKNRYIMCSALSLYSLLRLQFYDHVRLGSVSTVLLEKTSLAFRTGRCFYFFKSVELYENLCLNFFNLKLVCICRYVRLDFFFYFTREAEKCMHIMEHDLAKFLTTS